ncbi:MAG: SLATT domain-containing protein [Actinomycetota bacterium]|nr:SLATT domain-containing protein [Actinomycetota bacterium]
MSEAPGARSAGRRPPAWDSASETLLREWRNRTAAAGAAHYVLASRLRKRNLWVGVPAVVFSSVVGTSLFATLSRQEVNRWLRVVIGTVSVAAAVLAALQTFFRFPERAERHVLAADWYSALRRQLDVLIALPADERGPPKESLDRIRKEMSRVGQQAPEIGQQLWSKVAREHGIDEGPGPA